MGEIVQSVLPPGLGHFYDIRGGEIYSPSTLASSSGFKRDIARYNGIPVQNTGILTREVTRAEGINPVIVFPHDGIPHEVSTAGRKGLAISPYNKWSRAQYLVNDAGMTIGKASLCQHGNRPESIAALMEWYAAHRGAKLSSTAATAVVRRGEIIRIVYTDLDLGYLTCDMDLLRRVVTKNHNTPGGLQADEVLQMGLTTRDYPFLQFNARSYDFPDPNDPNGNFPQDTLMWGTLVNTDRRDSWLLKSWAHGIYPREIMKYFHIQ